MIKTTAMLHNELRQYANPAVKIKRMADSRIITPIIKGIYETDASTPLPTRSFTCIHTNCISNMNTQIKKVTMSNPMKCTNKYLSSFFNLFFS